MEPYMLIQKQIIEIIRKIIKMDITDTELVRINYLEKGIFDSFQMVEIITNLEDYFKIKFSVDDLTSPKFQTVDGMTEIIQSKINEK